MTARPLGFDFPLRSDLSQRLPHAIGGDEQRREIDQELADRCALYPRMVDRGTLRGEDAARHLDLVRAIGDDLAGAAVKGGRHPWEAKVRELRRELAIRRAAWPKRIAAGADPLDTVTAALRMERLDAVHFAYWIELRYCDEFASLATLEATLDQVRARVWQVMDWERSQWQAGPAAAAIVRPRMAAFYAELEAGERGAVMVWQAHRDAAERLGLVELERAAAE